MTVATRGQHRRLSIALRRRDLRQRRRHGSADCQMENCQRGSFIIYPQSITVEMRISS
jgi:hypothetical protein